MMKMAIHFPDKSFSLKKNSSGPIEIKTSGDNDTKNTICNIFSSRLKEELIEIFMDSSDPEFICKGIF